MAKSPEMHKFLDDFGKKVFGRSHSEAQQKAICVSCGKDATIFRNELSVKEYSLSGLCQECQDSVFGKD